MSNNAFNEYLKEIENKKMNLYTELTMRINHTNNFSDLVEEIKDDYYDDHCIYETLIENTLALIIIGRKIEELKWLGVEESNEIDRTTQALKEYLVILKEHFIDKAEEIRRSDIDKGMKKMIYDSCDSKVRKLIMQERTFGLIAEALEY